MKQNVTCNLLRKKWDTLKFINLSFTFKSIWNDSYRDASWTRVDRELYVHCSKIIKYSPSKARISAFTFFPSQLTVTVFPTMKGVSLSKISRVGAIPFFISCGKRYNAFFGALFTLFGKLPYRHDVLDEYAQQDRIALIKVTKPDLCLFIHSSWQEVDRNAQVLIGWTDFDCFHLCACKQCSTIRLINFHGVARVKWWFSLFNARWLEVAVSNM